jgi:hypothetical protein
MEFIDIEKLLNQIKEKSSDNITSDEAIAQLLKQMRDKSSNEIPWVKELLEKKELEIETKHNTNLIYSLENDNAERAYESFIDKFKQSILKCNLDGNIENLRNCKEIITSATEYCFDCDEYIQYSFDGKSITDTITDSGATISCFDDKNYSVSIEIPSGELICDDWMPYASDLLKHLDSHKHSINSELGKYERTVNYAEINVLHMFVGNSCPQVFYKNGTIVVGNYAYIEDEDEDEDEEDENDNED